MKNNHPSIFEKQRWLRKDGLRNWLISLPFSLSVTLTFKKDVSESVAVQQLDRFSGLLSAQLYRNRQQRNGKKFSMAAFMELQSSGRIHWHLLLYDGHGDGRFLLSKAEASKIILECCKKCSLLGHQFNIQDINSNNKEKTVLYVTKRAGKDLENFHEKWL